MAKPIEVYYTVQDGDGDKSTITIPIPSTTNLLDVPLFVQSMEPLLDALTNGGLVSAGFTVEIDLASSWPPFAAAISDVQEKAQFAFRTLGGWLKRIQIPTVLESIFGNGGASDQVDLANADVMAFVAAMENGIDLTGIGGSGTVQPCDSREDDLTTLEYAVEAWGKKRG